MTDPRITDEAVEAAARVLAYIAIAPRSLGPDFSAEARQALEAALPHLAPQPMVDRDALEKVFDDHRMHYAYGLSAACCCGWTPAEPQLWDRDHRAHVAAAVLALINGTVKDSGPVVPDSAVCDHDDVKADDYGAMRCTHCGLVF